MNSDAQFAGVVAVGRCTFRCCSCGKEAAGQSFKVDLALLGCTAQQLAEAVERESRRIAPRSFPVGWGRYHALPHDKFRCESCTGVA